MHDVGIFFVYGLLMSGGSGFRALGLDKRVKILGPEQVAGRLYHLGHYPGLILGPQGIVQGEALLVDDPKVTEDLDAYELYDRDTPARSEYCRVQVDLLTSGQRGWAYEYNRSVEAKPIIATGNWRTR